MTAGISAALMLPSFGTAHVVEFRRLGGEWAR
jgi:hypothetical protein